MLVDLHRQFDIQELNNRDFQLEVLDALASHEPLLRDYHSTFAQYRSVKTELQRLQTEQLEASKEYDYQQFLFNELEQANFMDNEIENLDAELKLMANAENIKSTLTTVANVFADGEEPVLHQLKSVISRIGSIKELVPSLAAIHDRIQSSLIELKDIADEIDMVNTDISFREERMKEINSRRETAYKLMKKHHVQTTQ